MSTNINSTYKNNNNIIAAKTLSDRATGSRKNIGAINLPEKIYVFSTDEYCKRMENLREEAEQESVYRQYQNGKIKSLGNFILKILYVSSIYLAVKNLKIPKK